MSARLSLTAMMVSTMLVGGCGGGIATPSSVAARPAVAQITIERGPCFGFCPVYDVVVKSDGAIAFDGKRHTAVIGERVRRGGPDTYRALAEALAPFRPAGDQETAVPCDAQISDTPTYRITWRTATGTAIATHRAGCPGGPGQALDRVLETVPARLHIADWAQQITRPGAGRG